MGNWTEQDLARVGQPDRKPRSPVDPAGTIVRGPNKTESAYGVYLKQLAWIPAEDRARNLGGLPKKECVAWFAFEAIKIRIGVRCWYTPDYLVQYRDGHLELHDCKGTKGDKYRAEDDAIVKARSVSAHFPLPVYFVWRLKNGEWQKVRM